MPLQDGLNLRSSDILTASHYCSTEQGKLPEVPRLVSNDCPKTSFSLPEPAAQCLDHKIQRSCYQFPQASEVENMKRVPWKRHQGLKNMAYLNGWIFQKGSILCLMCAESSATHTQLSTKIHTKKTSQLFWIIRAYYISCSLGQKMELTITSI